MPALPYILREGLAGFNRAKLAAATAVAALAVALVLIGVVGLLSWQGGQVAEHIRQRVGEVQVFLEPGTDRAVVGRLRRRFDALPAVDSTAYVSEAEAARIFRREFGDEAAGFDAGLLLPASFRVRLEGPYANADSVARLTRSVGAWPRVDEVRYEADLLARVERAVRLYAGLGLAVGLLVVGAALFLVGNTVRLTIHAKRLLIRTMKLVGATDGFIRRPFLVEGAAQGVAAGAIAAAVVWALYTWLGRVVEGLAAEPWPGGSPLPTLAGVVALGALLGWLASYVAVRTYVRRVRLS